MSRSSRIGATTAKWSIGIAALCYLVTPIFTPAIAVAALVCAIGGIAALVLGARRIALVAIAFALLPMGGLVVLQSLDASALSDSIVFVPLLAAVAAVALLLTGAVSQEDVENPFDRH